MSFAEELRTILSIDPAATAVQFEGAWLRWGELRARVGSVDAALDAAGAHPTARIGLLIRNRPPQLAAMLALLASRRCLVVLNPMLPPARLRSDIVACRAAAVIAEASDVADDAIRAAIAEAGSALVAIDGRSGEARLIDGFDRARCDAVGPSDGSVALEMLTSGTTGTPKRIPLTRRAFDAALDGAMAYEKDRRPGDPPKLRPGVVIQVAPISHIGGIFRMLAALLGGRRLALLEKFAVGPWRDMVVEHRPKVAALVPAALRMVLEANVPKEDLASIVAIRAGTAPLDPGTVREYLRRYDIPVLQMYGATEYIGGVAGWSLKDFRAHFETRPNSCGRIHDDVAARIVDPDSGEQLAPGVAGVLELKAAQLGDPDRWVRTTDRASIDAENFLTIVGRADNAIIRGGFKIHPDEIVRVLEQHDDVREAAVVGIPDARLGSVPAAAVIRRAGGTIDAAGLLAFARAHLTAYQVPTTLLFVDDLPRTPSMKPAADAVRALFAIRDTDRP